MGKKWQLKRGKIPKEHKRFAFTVLKDPSGVWTDLPMKHPKHPSDAVCQAVDGGLDVKQEHDGNVSNFNTNRRKRQRGEESVGRPPKRRKKRERVGKEEEDGYNRDEEDLHTVNGKYECSALADFIDSM